MNSDYEDRTVEELRDDLRERDLRVSGSKEELIARLQEDDVDAARDAPSSAPAGMRDALARIRRDLREVTGLQVERASGLNRDNGGWRALVEVVEVSRIPPSTDVLAVYEVNADSDGAVTSFERIQRYRRSEAGV